MVDVRELGHLQLDGLREVANIGAGHAATALSQLTNRRIMVGVPQVRVLRIDEISDMIGTGEEVVAGVAMQMLGDLTGRTVQIFPKDTAERVTGILVGRDDVVFPDGFGELEQSALKEVGNILGGAYLNALSDFLGLLLLMSVPGLAMDVTAAVLKSTFLEFQGALQTVERAPLLLLVTVHGDEHAGMAQVRRCLDSGHGDESDPRVLQL